MNLQSILSHKILAPLTTLFITGIFILWDYFHGGVPTHYLLADENMPGFSNWWGLLTIPCLTWIVITLVQKRAESAKPSVWANFLGALVFGIIIAMLWEFRLEHILQYLILLPVAISFFKAVHFPESLLGFVLGMLYTFGGVLPILIGTVLLLLSLFATKVIREGILLLVAKISGK